MKRFIEIVFVFFLFYLFFFLRKDAFYVTTTSHINILKAIGWLSGNPDWLGPNIPYFNGNLPGPFFYFLLIPPLLLDNPYTSIILWTVIWLSLTFTLAFYFVKKHTKDKLSTDLFLMLLLTSCFFYENFFYLELNSLFSIIFHLVLMICLFQWRKKKEDLYLVFLGIFMGLGVQVHHSIFFHFITIFIFLITNEKIVKGQFEWKYLMAFISLFLLPQIPYLSVLFSDNSNLYIRNYDYDQIQYYITQFVSHPSNFFKKFFESLGIHSKIGMAHIFSIFVLGMTDYIYKNFKKEKHLVDRSVLTLFFIAINPIFLIFPIIDSYLNSFFLFLFFIIFFIKWHDNFWPNKLTDKYFIFLFFVFILGSGLILSSDIETIILSVVKKSFFIFLLAMWLAGTILMNNFLSWEKKYSFLRVTSLTLIFLISIPFNEFSSPSYEFKMVLKHIYKNTGWDSEETEKRVFQFGFNKLDFLFYHKLVVEEIGSIVKKGDHQTINKGYFIIKNKKLPNRNWFLNSKFPFEIKKEIKEDSIIVNSPYKIEERVWLVPYNFKKHSIFYKGFHNIGKTDFKEPDWSKNSCFFPSLIKDKNRFYLCHILYNYVGEKISFFIKFSKIKEQTFVEVKITGYPLTITSAQRKDFHSIKDIFVNFSCDEKKHKIKLLSYIGYNVTNSEYFKSFFAPIEIRKTIKCKNIVSINNLTVTFNHKVGYSEEKPVSFSYPPEIKY